MRQLPVKPEQVSDPAVERAPRDMQDDFGPEPISAEEENLELAINTFEKEIHAHGGNVHAAAIEVFRMVTGT